MPTGGAVGMLPGGGADFDEPLVSAGLVTADEGSPSVAAPSSAFDAAWGLSTLTPSAGGFFRRRGAPSPSAAASSAAAGAAAAGSAAARGYGRAKRAGGGVDGGALDGGGDELVEAHRSLLLAFGDLRLRLRLVEVDAARAARRHLRRLAQREAGARRGARRRARVPSS